MRGDQGVHGRHESGVPVLSIRQQWLESATLGDDFHQLSDIEKMKVVTNLANVKLTAQYIVDAFSHRLRILFLRNGNN